MYTGKIILTNPRNIPLALSNHFDDTFGLTDGLREINTAEEFCKLANEFHRYGRTWKIDKDRKTETRLLYEDSLGNKYYLIAKKKVVVQTEPVDKKTLYEVIGTEDIKGHSFVICTTYDKALKAQKVLKDLCQVSNTEIATRVSVDMLFINDMEIKL